MDEIRNLREIALRHEQLLKDILYVLGRSHELQHAAFKAGKKSPSEWLDKQEVLDMLHISDRTLCTLRKEGLVKQHQLRGKMYYSASQIRQYLENSKPSDRTSR